MISAFLVAMHRIDGMKGYIKGDRMFPGYGSIVWLQQSGGSGPKIGSKRRLMLLMPTECLRGDQDARLGPVYDWSPGLGSTACHTGISYLE